MKKYTLTIADSIIHTPDHPERTAFKSVGFSVIYQVWNSATALKKSIDMQESRSSMSTDWRPCNRAAMLEATLEEVRAKIARIEKETAAAEAEVS